jgi:hypothetical protein
VNETQSLILKNYHRAMRDTEKADGELVDQTLVGFRSDPGRLGL